MILIHKLMFIVVLFFLLVNQSAIAASLNFTVNEKNVKRGDDVTYTFKYTLFAGDIPPDTLTLELDYDNDNSIDYSVVFDTFEKNGIKHDYTMSIPEAGFFDSHAKFRITRVKSNGEEISDVKELGPLRINVAKWIFTDHGMLGCVESTPAVSSDGSMLVAGSEDGNIYAIDTNTGIELWRFTTQGSVNSSPALAPDNNTYVGSEDGYVYCLNSSGVLVWSFLTAGPVYSSPALDVESNRMFIGSNDTNLYCLQMDTGKVLWQFPTGGKIVSSPVIGYIGPKKTVYIGSLDDHLYALDSEDGSEKWRFDAQSDIVGAPCLDSDGTIFFGTVAFRGGMDDKNGLFAISTTGDKKWYIKHPSGFFSSPVIDATGTLCIGSNFNTLYGVDRNGEKLIMFYQFPDDMVFSPALGSNKLVFAGSKAGVLFGLSLYDGDEISGRKQRWSYDFGLPITTSSPVIKDGYLYGGACGYDSGAIYSLFCDLDRDKNDVQPMNSPWPLARNTAGNMGKTGYLPETTAPEISFTEPARGETDFDVNKPEPSIVVHFSKSMDPASIYSPGNENEEPYYGFTVEPFDSPQKDFIPNWSDNNTVCELMLPQNESFKPYIKYTATILSRAHAADMPKNSNRSILYNYTWSFEHTSAVEESYDYSPSTGCFISTILKNRHGK